MSSWKEKEAAIKALERGGKVNPLDLIQAARSPDHPCHNDFTWDIQAAAEERWRDQARAMIRQCKFEVVYEDITTPVVQYVPSGDDETVFLSLPKIRSSSKVSLVLSAELRMLHGLASRVYGIALSKQNIVGTSVVSELEAIKNQLAALKESMEE
jgi:hypothetical protein